MAKKREWIRQKSVEEIKQAFLDQVGFLRRSSQAYDDGIEAEAARLATSVYVLVNDNGKNSRSLLTQLDLKKVLKLPCTVATRTKYYANKTYFSLTPPMVGMQNRNGKVHGFFPSFGELDKMEMVSFSKWYDANVYQAGRSGKWLKRRNLVFNLRSRDGGAHLDPEFVDEAYHSLASKSVDMGVTDPKGLLKFAAVGGQDGPFSNGHLATMRQIAWELDEAIKLIGY